MRDRALFRFNPRKGTQAVAWLLKKAPNATTNEALLLKLIYLADREALAKWSLPITGDEPHALQTGPAPSHIYDLTRGSIRYANEWEPFMDVKPSGQIRLARDPGADELSESERDLLDGVFAKFGGMSAAEIQDYCLRLPECENLSSSERSRPIPFERLLEILGKSQEEIRYVVESERASLVLRDLAGA